MKMNEAVRYAGRVPRENSHTTCTRLPTGLSAGTIGHRGQIKTQVRASSSRVVQSLQNYCEVKPPIGLDLLHCFAVKFLNPHRRVKLVSTTTYMLRRVRAMLGYHEFNTWAYGISEQSTGFDHRRIRLGRFSEPHSTLNGPETQKWCQENNYSLVVYVMQESV